MQTILEDGSPSAVPDRRSSSRDRRALRRPDPPAQSTSQNAEISPNLEVLMDLGEGTFGQVKLVYDRANPSTLMALVKQCRTEAFILRACRGHPNVIQYLSMRCNERFVFQIFMEYADGGELFDQIEPDVGIGAERARFFFRQLIDGLVHIHSKGHVLKIADFGFATIYKLKGKEKILTEPCGTPEYSDPNVFKKHYRQALLLFLPLFYSSFRGEFADVWSAGVVLAVMLTGDLPWEEPNSRVYSYYEFVHKKICTHPPWSRIGSAELSLLRTIFVEDFDRRADLAAVQRHSWLTDERRAVGSPTANFDYISTPKSNVASSQPVDFKSLSSGSCSQRLDLIVGRFGLPSTSFSQPHGVEALILSSSQMSEPNADSFYHPVQTFVRRMTRFCATAGVSELLGHIEDACLALGCSSRFTGPQSILVSCTLRKRTVRYSIRIYEIGGRQLVDARCSYGNGIDFKRAFAALRDQLKPHICGQSDEWLREVGLLPSRLTERLENVMNSSEDSSDSKFQLHSIVFDRSKC
ncbi:Serine/threonine-protein kinase chk-1 [Aphelenchoides fujianensis]|nr:Serine/threonine-protein kinase chk-1 [Aphelenchoides fujianensis]